MVKNRFTLWVVFLLLNVGLVHAGLYKVTLRNFTLVPIDVQIINASCKDDFVTNIPPNQEPVVVDLGGICCIKGIKIKSSKIGLSISDYVNISRERGKEFCELDLKELEKIKNRDGSYLFKSYLYREIEPYLVPYFDVPKRGSFLNGNGI